MASYHCDWHDWQPCAAVGHLSNFEQLAFGLLSGCVIEVCDCAGNREALIRMLLSRAHLALVQRSAMDV